MTSLDKSGQAWTSDVKHRRDSEVGHGNFKTSSNASLGQDPQKFSRGSLKPLQVLMVLTILGTFKTCQVLVSLGLDQVWDYWVPLLPALSKQTDAIFTLKYCFIWISNDWLTSLNCHFKYCETWYHLGPGQDASLVLLRHPCLVKLTWCNFYLKAMSFITFIERLAIVLVSVKTQVWCCQDIHA